MPEKADAPAAAESAKPSGPQARAELHAARKAAKALRMAKSPGPGAYSPANASTLKATGKPTSSFTSKTKRLVESLSASAAGDPGSYDPYTLKDLASTSKKSFAKSFRSGSGGFGTRDKRELQIQLTGENTPGAGAYNGGDMMRNGMKGALAAMDTGEKMPSSAFKSKSKKDVSYHDEKVPGAGAYSPAWSAIEPVAHNPANGMKAKGQRFEKVKQVTGDMVGPGAYESHHERSLASDLKKSVSMASRANPGFGCLMPAHELPFLDDVQDAQDMPGPGAYESNKSTLNSRPGSGHASAFKSQTKRMVEGLGAAATGDPGSYDPYTNMELAKTSKKSFGRSNRAGMGDFGTRDKRELRLEVMGEKTPGPGAYNGDLMMKNGMKANLSAFDTSEKYPSSAFQSKSKKDVSYHDEKVPGPGQYAPKFDLVQPKLSQNPAHSMKAKGNRFKKNDAFERAQASEPGPGAYETEILRTGGRSALSAYDTGEMMPSAAFASDTIRGMPWPDASTGKVAAAAAS